ncbi:MAG: hypothetical protein PHQ23_08100 [Candidatus Wallbacteria bacterium]|nr:hypothetical protein [Candidatus Wallbacteria bacterium]
MKNTLISIIIIMLALQMEGCRKGRTRSTVNAQQLAVLVPDKALPVKMGDTQNRVTASRGEPAVKHTIFISSKPYLVWIYQGRSASPPPEDYFCMPMEEAILPAAGLTMPDDLKERKRYSEFDPQSRTQRARTYLLADTYIFFTLHAGHAKVLSEFREDRYTLITVDASDWDRSSLCQMLIDEHLDLRLKALLRDVTGSGDHP